MSRATQINQAIARAVYGQEAISRTVKFTFENLEATESALFELFTMCEEFGTPPDSIVELLRHLLLIRRNDLENPDSIVELFRLCQRVIP